MSFYRALLSTIIIVFALPVFANEVTIAAQTLADDAVPMQLADNSNIEVSAVPEAPQLTKININIASVKDLMKVKGISPTKARAIVSYRKKNGKYKTVDDLKLVKGFKKMKEDKLKDIQEQIVAE